MIKEDTGYKISVDRIIDINKGTKEYHEEKFNATAFMDDTTLISNNKSNLSKMTKVCHEFFMINDIKANIKKYELIRVNPEDKDQTYEIENTAIDKINNVEGNRYLGIFFKHNNKRKHYVNNVRKIIDKACKILAWKKLTDKQIIAVWNMVIIPRIEFQLQSVVLNKLECTKLMGRINKLTKHRGNLATSTPNCFMYDKDLFGLKNIYDLQLEILCKNILYQANGNTKISNLFKIKIFQLQQELWLASCVGESGILMKRNKQNYIADAIALLNQENIHLCDHEIKSNTESLDHRIKGGKIEIWSILSEKDYTNAKISCKNKQLLFIDQLLEADNLKIMKWKH
jgi:hypothetical protein